ncbi:cytochrome-c peroxidase [Mesonia aestuariivivens]|uniref:Cytochrome-c peroxidase n=1 Tax=Mesonia aestuariivivens TaxID=2796128 RepID=A0ABS6VZP4_9FLAO|nr:cytochrome c peroxidase [Mesonia aestuariivivens]MBW2960373.1 cytochrome-c peroxidase [Mesonia aestuariivivens]
MKIPLKVKLLKVMVVFSVIAACKNEQKNKKTEASLTKVNWSSAQNYYLENSTKTLKYLDSLNNTSVKSAKAKAYFIKTREAFKEAEPYASYLKPEVGHQANGPALPRLTEDTQRVLLPIGLQKIEESIYEGGVSENDFKREIELTRGLMQVLHDAIEKRELNAQRFFIATHQQLMRIVSFGITGFDTPVSGLGLKETKASLKNLLTVYKLSIQKTIKIKEPKLDEKFQQQISHAIGFIGKNPDFNSFDRYTFLRDYFNPVMRSWVDIRKTSAIWEPVNNKPFNFDAPTFFEDKSFNVDYFRKATNKAPSQAKITLGKRLFFDKNLSHSANMACVTCHQPSMGYADGLVANVNNIGNPLKRNSPTLINSIFQKGFFWDGRAGSLLAQISGVFTNKEEFNSSVHEFSDKIAKDSSYIKDFEKAFGKKVKWTNTETIKALSAYISTLNGFSSKFDKNIRGEEKNFTPQEQLGMNLFMGKALCATCHFMPLTSGTVPPFFSETEKEVIGVPETASNKKLDNDTGFYFMYKEPIQKGMFKTPTVRNVAFTAPYMHNGVYESLEEVINFYNKGGGAGLGFNLPHQTLPFDNLDLSEKEQQALVAFMKTLTDLPE